MRRAGCAIAATTVGDRVNVQPVYAIDATHGVASYRRALHRCGLECCGNDGEGLHAALYVP